MWDSLNKISHVRYKLGAPGADWPSPCLTHCASGGGSRTLLVGIVRNGTFERGLVGKHGFGAAAVASWIAVVNKNPIVVRRRDEDIIDRS